MIFAEPTSEEIEHEGPGIYFNRFVLELDHINDDLATGTGEHGTIDLIDCFWEWYKNKVTSWTFDSGITLIMPPHEVDQCV